MGSVRMRAWRTWYGHRVSLFSRYIEALVVLFNKSATMHVTRKQVQKTRDRRVVNPVTVRMLDGGNRMKETTL